ncbi:MAG: hypothetical protein ACFE9D_10920 [Promethearchaeota archaeon]
MLQFFPLILLDFVIAGALALIGLTLGLFFLVYVIMMIYAGMNPWVRDVERMDWCCNPAFDIWYYTNQRRKWVAANFGGSILFAVIFWFLLMLWNSFYYLPVFGDLIFNTNLVISFTLGVLILIPIGYGIVHLHAR